MHFCTICEHRKYALQYARMKKHLKFKKTWYGISHYCNCWVNRCLTNLFIFFYFVILCIPTNLVWLKQTKHMKSGEICRAFWKASESSYNSVSLLRKSICLYILIRVLCYVLHTTICRLKEVIIRRRCKPKAWTLHGRSY